MFTFLPHSDLAEEQGHVILGKGNKKCYVVLYAFFSGSNN